MVQRGQAAAAAADHWRHLRAGVVSAVRARDAGAADGQGVHPDAVAAAARALRRSRCQPPQDRREAFDVGVVIVESSRGGMDKEADWAQLARANYALRRERRRGGPGGGAAMAVPAAAAATTRVRTFRRNQVCHLCCGVFCVHWCLTE